VFDEPKSQGDQITHQQIPSKKITNGDSKLKQINTRGNKRTEKQLNKSADTLTRQAPNLSIALPPINAANTIGMMFPAPAIPVAIGEYVNCNTKIGIATAAI
jgi:hypothetical protein